MRTNKLKNMKRITKILATGLMFFTLSSAIKTDVYATNLQDAEDQYMELKVVSVKDIEDADKQVILEWWSYNLDFKGLDLRFSYNKDKLRPSNIIDNTYAVDESTFSFVSDFDPCMIYGVLPSEEGTYRCYMSLADYDDKWKYVDKGVEDDDYYVNTNVEGGVLIGKMSFRLFTNDNLTTEDFSLKTGTTTPNSGIKISRNYLDAYENQSVFRFKVLSNDAKLEELKYNFFNYEDEEKTKPTIPDADYTDIDLDNPSAGSTEDISKYTINLDEYLENISLKTVTSNENATVKIKTDTMTSQEEWDIAESKEIELNALGKEDTIIEIEVTAQDGTTIHTYEITVHRPFATIKGRAILGDYDPYTSTGQDKIQDVFDNYGVTVNDLVAINLYQAGNVRWEEISDIFETIYSPHYTYDDLELETIIKEYESDNDGTFEIYVIPNKKIDIQITRMGYLDYIYKNIDLNENDTFDMSSFIMLGGDANRDGIITAEDTAIYKKSQDITSADSDFKPEWNPSQTGVVVAEDTAYAKKNQDQEIQINNF